MERQVLSHAHFMMVLRSSAGGASAREPDVNLLSEADRVAHLLSKRHHLSPNSRRELRRLQRKLGVAGDVEEVRPGRCRFSMQRTLFSISGGFFKLVE